MNLNQLDFLKNSIPSLFKSKVETDQGEYQLIINEDQLNHLIDFGRCGKIHFDIWIYTSNEFIQIKLSDLYEKRLQYLFHFHLVDLGEENLMMIQ